MNKYLARLLSRRKTSAREMTVFWHFSLATRVDVFLLEPSVASLIRLQVGNHQFLKRTDGGKMTCKNNVKPYFSNVLAVMLSLTLCSMMFLSACTSTASTSTEADASDTTDSSTVDSDVGAPGEDSATDDSDSDVAADTDASADTNTDTGTLTINVFNAYEFDTPAEFISESESTIKDGVDGMTVLRIPDDSGTVFRLVFSVIPTSIAEVEGFYETSPLEKGEATGVTRVGNSLQYIEYYFDLLGPGDGEHAGAGSGFENSCGHIMIMSVEPLPDDELYGGIDPSEMWNSESVQQILNSLRAPK